MSVGFSDLLQRLKSRERDRQQRLQRPRNRDNRKSLSYDASPFYMTGDAGADSVDVASSSNTDLTVQKRQLGERLYPKVQAIQPVSFI